MKIFLSHASEQRTIAEEIALALREDGDEVFLDASDLTEGGAYDERICDAIRDADLFVFLLSPEAVAAGRYTLSEIRFAEEKWPNPAGRVLPVVVRHVDRTAIPPYLRAVVILEPQGNVAAEVGDAVRRFGHSRWSLGRSVRVALILTVLAIAGGLGLWRGYLRLESRQEAARLVAHADLDRKSSNYTAAWDRCSTALALDGESDVVRLGCEGVAMDWLDNVHAIVRTETFTDVAAKVEPTLVRAAGAKDAKRAADALAHLGWAAYLRSKDVVTRIDPTVYYERAIERDADNPFAHAMWGYFILTSNGSIADAEVHFSRAVASERERTYVRRMELRGHLLTADLPLQAGLVRVLSEMSANAEDFPFPISNETDTSLWDIWNVYYDRLVAQRDRAVFLKIVPPADHLRTFSWLFPIHVVPEEKRPTFHFMLAQLQELAGQTTGALDSYRSALDELTTHKLQSRIAPDVMAGIRRLQAK